MTSTSVVPPGLRPDGFFSDFTLAQRQVLAFLFVYGQQPQRGISSSTELNMGGAAVQVLRSLEKRAWVARSGTAWDLTPFVVDLMTLGYRATVHGVVEGSR